MFKLVQKPKEGACAAVRCNAAPLADENPDNPKLCERHWAEWQGAGFPALESSGAGRPAKRASKGGALAVSEDLKAELAAEETSAKDHLAMLDAELIIATQADMDQADAMLTFFGDRKKSLEARRLAVSGPLRQAWEAHNAQFRPARDYLDAAIKLIKGRQKEFLLAQDAAQNAALTHVEHGARDESTLVVAHGVENVQTSKPTRKVVRHRIVNPAEVPYDLCSPDPRKIQAVVDQYGMQCAGQIPGVEVYEDMEIINRG